MSTHGQPHRQFEYNVIGKITFGVDASREVGSVASDLTAGRKCLIVTDAVIVKNGLISGIEQALKDAGFSLDICEDVEPEPTLAGYEAVLDKAKAFAPDIMVAVGGGSSLDTGKTVAAALTNPKPLAEYVEDEFERDPLPLITIPTTAGTGAELTADTVVRLPDEKMKACFLNAQATAAIIDPALTLTVPPKLTAATGIDALSHAIESALTKEATPFTQALALESVRLISRNLRIAVFDGEDLAARTNMAWATMMEAVSEGHAGDCEGHGIAHILGAFYRLHHGEACSIALPYCMKYNLHVNLPILSRIATAMDENISGTPMEMARKGILAVKELIADIGTCAMISDIEAATWEDIPELVDLYCNHPVNTGFLEAFAKRGVPTREEAQRLFEEMFKPVTVY